MVVTVTAVHMLVRNLFFRSGTHIGDLGGETQRLASQRVVAIQMHFRTLDLRHVENRRLPIRIRALERIGVLTA